MCSTLSRGSGYPHQAHSHADKGYDERACRAYLRRRGIKVRIARKGVEPKDRLGRHRWQVEQSIAWLLGCRRLRNRSEQRSERFYGFGLLACCRLAFNRYTDHTTLRPNSRCWPGSHAPTRRRPGHRPGRGRLPATGLPARQSGSPGRGGPASRAFQRRGIGRPGRPWQTRITQRRGR
jgi:Transposase DDE domain